jgi:hypothetical protein
MELWDAQPPPCSKYSGKRAAANQLMEIGCNVIYPALQDIWDHLRNESPERLLSVLSSALDVYLESKSQRAISSGPVGMSHVLSEARG